MSTPSLSCPRPWRKIFAAAVLLTPFFALVPPAGAGEVLRVGVGTSLLADPAEAAREAALQAKQNFGDAEEAKLVLVYAAMPMFTPALVESLAEHFPAGILYGSQAAAPLTPDTNVPDAPQLDADTGVGVLAMGGEVSIKFYAQTTEAADDPELEAIIGDGNTVYPEYAAYRLAGRRLGAQMAAAMADCPSPGHLAVTGGDQNTGPNVEVAAGLGESLGNRFPVVGAASARDPQTGEDRELIAGELTSGMIFAVSICGDFRLGQSRQQGQHTPETTDLAMASALAEGDGAQPLFAFIFDCRRRRLMMRENDELADEHAVFLRRMDGVPFFGMYGPGEIGATAFGEPVEGVAFSVATAVLFPLEDEGR